MTKRVDPAVLQQKQNGDLNSQNENSQSGGQSLAPPAFELQTGGLPVQRKEDPNAILGTLNTTGASEKTANQDKIGYGGVDASKKLAQNDQKRVAPYAKIFLGVGSHFGLPPALLAAIASRETRGKNILYGDHGNGVGMMQVDQRYHKEEAEAIRKAKTEEQQILLGVVYGTQILKNMLVKVQKAHPDWSYAWQLRGAVAAYNSGSGNVQTKAGMDAGTTGDDYSADVWSRAQYYASLDEFKNTDVGIVKVASQVAALAKDQAEGKKSEGNAETKKSSAGGLSGSVGLAKNGSYIGSRDDIIKVQTALINAGYLPKTYYSKKKQSDVSSADGSLGEQTIKAIKDFQRKVVGDPNPDGRIDPGYDTWDKLSKYAGGGVQGKSDREVMYDIYQQYNSGKIDMIQLAKGFKPYIKKDPWAIQFLFSNLPLMYRDNLAYAITSNSSDSELAGFPKHVLIRMLGELDTWLTFSMAENQVQRERIKKALGFPTGDEGKKEDKQTGEAANQHKGLVDQLKSMGQQGGFDNQDARDKAIAHAERFFNENPGKSYGYAGSQVPEPGETVDCSGLVRSCIIAAGYPDPYNDQNGKYNPGMPKKGGGKWTNGVAELVSNPDWKKITYDEMEKGDAATFKTTRSDHKGEDGEFDHIGMVTSVTKENGKLISFTFIHSSSSNGPRQDTYNLEKGLSWIWLKGAYKWDFEKTK